jgi:hypothetical protein
MASFFLKHEYLTNNNTKNTNIKSTPILIPNARLSFALLYKIFKLIPNIWKEYRKQPRIQIRRPRLSLVLLSKDHDQYWVLRLVIVSTESWIFAVGPHPVGPHWTGGLILPKLMNWYLWWGGSAPPPFPSATSRSCQASTNHERYIRILHPW